MTIAKGKTPYHRYTPGSAMSAEAIPFEFLDTTDLTVRVVGGEPLTEGVDYELAGDWHTGAGTIRALIDAGSAEWELYSETPDEQQLELAETRRVPLQQYERELDRQAIRARENRRDLGRAAKVAHGQIPPDINLDGVEDGDILQYVNGTLKRVDRSLFAGKFYGGDADGRLTPLNGSGVDAGLRADLASVGATAGLALIRYAGFGVDAIARRLDLKFRDFGIYVTDYGADPDNVLDSGPAFRAARNVIAVIGRGEIIVPEGTYRFDSYETVKYWTTGDNGPVQLDWNVCLALPEGVGLVGRGSSKTKFKRSGGSIQAIIFCHEWGDATLRGFEVEGAGSSNNSHHGIFFGSSESFDHVMENFAVEDIYVHDVGSYGIGNHMQARGRLRGITTRRTGADGLDWKIRGPSGLANIVGGPTYFNGLYIEEYGQRPGAGQASGAGFRGHCIINGIVVKGSNPTYPAIDIQTGVAIATTGDFRPMPMRTTITDWYAEGADPKANNLGLRLSSAEAVVVGVGTAKWCNVSTIENTSSPYPSEGGGSITGVTVIPAHGWRAFEFSDAQSTAIGCRVFSDKDYFDAKRVNLAAGQTVFNLPRGTSTANGVVRLVYKNGAKLTEGADYTWGATSVTLASGVLATDEIMVVFPPSHGYWWDAKNCHISGSRQDKHVPNPPTPANGNAQNTSEWDVMWDDHRGLTTINSASATGIQAINPASANQALRLQGQGTGPTEASRLALINAPTSAAATPSGQVWVDAADGYTVKYKP